MPLARTTAVIGSAARSQLTVIALLRLVSQADHSRRIRLLANQYASYAKLDYGDVRFPVEKLEDKPTLNGVAQR